MADIEEPPIDNPAEEKPPTERQGQDQSLNLAEAEQLSVDSPNEQTQDPAESPTEHNDIEGLSPHSEFRDSFNAEAPQEQAYEENKVESHDENYEAPEEEKFAPVKALVPTNVCIEWMKQKLELDDYTPEL